MYVCRGGLNVGWWQAAALREEAARRSREVEELRAKLSQLQQHAAAEAAVVRGPDLPVCLLLVWV